MCLLPHFRLVEDSAMASRFLSLTGVAPIKGALAFNGQSGQLLPTLPTLLHGGQDANIRMLNWLI